MATPRLTFLYPHLFRSLRADGVESGVRIHQAASRTRARASASSSSGTRTFSSTVGRGVAEQRFVRRHGKAAGPFVPPGEKLQENKVFVREDTATGAAAEGTTKSTGNGNGNGNGKKKKRRDDVGPLSEETLAAERLPGEEGGPALPPPAPKSASKEPAAPNEVESMISQDTVLHMDPPADFIGAGRNGSKPPHLQATPYVHHFDTFTLVREVETGGFTHDQAVTAMKAVRGLLTTNLEVAKEGLVSKSDVENEVYLFEAACSELRTEIENSRRAKEEKMRRERTLLQHEVEILNQKLNQELMVLKDDLRGMFNDRKMAVRTEQRTMESSVSPNPPLSTCTLPLPLILRTTV
jgi:hypothetical protein